MSLRDYVTNKEQGVGPGRILGAPVHVLLPFTADIDMSEISRGLKSIFPNLNISSVVDGVYIGDFSFLRDREVEALYADGAVYVDCNTEAQDVLPHLVHEISHIVEQALASELLYDDGALELEFLKKKRELKNRLSENPQHERRLRELGQSWWELDFQPEVDNFLLNEVGYHDLHVIGYDIFVDPYASSSISEYYATGFERYFLKKDIEYLESVSPVLYFKLTQLEKLLRGEEYAKFGRG